MSHEYQMVRVDRRSHDPYAGEVLFSFGMGNGSHYEWQAMAMGNLNFDCLRPVSENTNTGEQHVELWGTYIWDREPFEVTPQQFRNAWPADFDGPIKESVEQMLALDDEDDDMLRIRIY